MFFRRAIDKLKSRDSFGRRVPCIDLASLQRDVGVTKSQVLEAREVFEALARRNLRQRKAR